MITDGSFKCKDGRWVMMLGVESRLHWTKTITALELQDSLVRFPNPQSCARELALTLLSFSRWIGALRRRVSTGSARRSSRTSDSPPRPTTSGEADPPAAPADSC